MSRLTITIDIDDAPHLEHDVTEVACALACRIDLRYGGEAKGTVTVTGDDVALPVAWILGGENEVYAQLGERGEG